MKRIVGFFLMACSIAFTAWSCSVEEVRPGISSMNDPLVIIESSSLVIVPGESMRGPWLGITNSFRISGDGDGHLGYMFELSLDLAIDLDKTSEKTYRLIPRESLFEAFGEDSQNVKASFEEIYTEYKNSFETAPANGFITTIYYGGGLVITADTDFAGVPAGGNIAPKVHLFPDELRQYNQIPTISVPEGYVPLKTSNTFKIWIDDYEVTKEYVDVHVEMPVKVGMMLTLLHDRLSNPQAQMQYRDEVLVGDFWLPRGLH